jgi:hypothetical protein
VLGFGYLKGVVVMKPIFPKISSIIMLIFVLFIIMANPASASDPGTAKGGTTSSGASRSNTQWSFADGYSGYSDYFAIRNTSANTVTAYFWFYDEYGLIGGTGVTIPSNRRGTVYANNYVPGGRNFCTHVFATDAITAERSMYYGCEGSCGDGLWGNSQVGWVFGDVYSDSGSMSYIELNNRSSYGNNYWRWKGTGGTPSVQSAYVPGYCRYTWPVTTFGNSVIVIGSDSSPFFTAERSWVGGSKLTSSGGTPYFSDDQMYFAEGYSNFPTWITSGWTDFSTDYTRNLSAYLRYSWPGGSAYNFIVIPNNSAWSQSVSSVPAGQNYSTLSDFYGFNKQVNWYWYFCSERTSFAPNGYWATSSEGRNMYDYPGQAEFFFADCYTGHDVYLSFANHSNNPTATFHVWVTTDTANNYSFDVTISKILSVRLNNYIPGAQTCSIHVREINNTWPVAVEKSSYFN